MRADTWRAVEELDTKNSPHSHGCHFEVVISQYKNVTLDILQISHHLGRCRFTYVWHKKAHSCFWDFQVNLKSLLMTRQPLLLLLKDGFTESICLSVIYWNNQNSHLEMDLQLVSSGIIFRHTVSYITENLDCCLSIKTQLPFVQSWLCLWRFLHLLLIYWEHASHYFLTLQTVGG